MHVIIAGGGIAALEAALALDRLAGDHVNIELIAPDEEFVYRPMTVIEPFGGPAAERFPLAEIAHEAHADVIVDRLAWVDRTGRCVHTESHRVLAYDCLVLGLGAQARVQYEHAVTIDGRSGDPALAGLVADLDRGRIGRLAFVVPALGSWQLPLYELALLTAARARQQGLALNNAIFTPEAAPLEAFGAQAGAAIAQLLADQGIELTCGVDCRVPNFHTVATSPRQHLGLDPGRPGGADASFDRILALPRLLGPQVRGIPSMSNGFIPIDPHGRVRGARRVYAAGDGTDSPVKHGGMAAQQADAAARSIATLAGADVEPAPAHPVIHGLLITGEQPRYLGARIIGGHGLESTASTRPSWSPPEKLEATYLAATLTELRSAREHV
ncbi:MAG: hypothetical protein ACLPZR_16485 [Solirubrobacteraceae bacterium]